MTIGHQGLGFRVMSAFCSRNTWELDPFLRVLIRRTAGTPTAGTSFVEIP